MRCVSTARVSEQFELAVVGLDRETRRPLGLIGTFALPPVAGGPVEIHARCMVCDRRAVAPVEAGPALDAARKLGLARKALREAGCTHTKAP